MLGECSTWKLLCLQKMVNRCITPDMKAVMISETILNDMPAYVHMLSVPQVFVMPDSDCINR